MPLPCDGLTAFVVGNGPDVPADRLGELDGYLTIGVNRVWKYGFTPTICFWIDSEIYTERPAFYDAAGLCVCDASNMPTPKRCIHIETRGGRLPRDLNPNRLCHRANAGVMAALWAVSVGCHPVVLLGMGCQDDGRAGHQMHTMRAALEELVIMEYRRPGKTCPTVWPWRAEDFALNIQSGHISKADGEGAVAALREFYR